MTVCICCKINQYRTLNSSILNFILIKLDIYITYYRIESDDDYDDYYIKKLGKING